MLSRLIWFYGSTLSCSRCQDVAAIIVMCGRANAPVRQYPRGRWFGTQQLWGAWKCNSNSDHISDKQLCQLLGHSAKGGRIGICNPVDTAHFVFDTSNKATNCLVNSLGESKDATLNPFQGGLNTGSTKAREATIYFMNACKSKL